MDFPSKELHFFAQSLGPLIISTGVFSIFLQTHIHNELVNSMTEAVRDHIHFPFYISLKKNIST